MDNLNESVKNLQKESDKKLKIKYTDQVWDILQEAYNSNISNSSGLLVFSNNSATLLTI